MAVMDAGSESISAESLRKSGWEKAIERASGKEAQYFFKALSDEAKRAREAGDPTRARSLRFLADICAMYFKLDDPGAPFGPKFTSPDGRRTMLPEDLTAGEMAAIQEIYPSVEDPELRGRLADVLWLASRDHHAAEAAVLAYLESTKRLENPDSSVEGCERIERALQVAKSLSNQKLVDEVVGQIEGLLDKYRGEDPKFGSKKLMELLLAINRGDPDRYTEFAKKAAARAEAQKDWYGAEAYWSIAASWRHEAGDAEGEKTLRELAAETFVKAADSIPSALIASSFLERAVEAHRRLGNKARAEELHRRLIETQKNSVQELKTVSTEIDLAQWVQKARDAVSGKSLLEALLTLAGIVRVPSVKDLREQIERTGSRFPLPYILGTSIVSATGKKVAGRPSMLADDDKEKEEATQAEMYRQAIFHQQTSAVGLIEPARNQILLEHSPRINDFLPLLTSNPFVPSGREYLYAKGQYHGMQGDFIAAVHILVPQIENSFRYVLGNHGVVVSGLNADGVQEEFDLNRLLQMKEMTEILGEDLRFDLNGLLCSRFGTNLRNRLSHGLLGAKSFEAPACVYLWWISLFLCCAPIASRIRMPSSAAETNSDKAGSLPEE